MLAGDILFGRPWQYDKKVTFDGLMNKYTFTLYEKKFILLPLSPYEVHCDKLKLENKRKEYEEQQLERRNLDKSEKKKKKRKVRGQRMSENQERKKSERKKISREKKTIFSSCAERTKNLI